MRRTEAKQLQTLSYVLHHLFNDLSEQQQRMITQPLVELDQILDDNSELGLLRQFKIVETIMKEIP